LIQQNSHKIRFKDQLYGRKDKLSELKALYDSRNTDSSNLVLVKGVSGVGKTSFILNFSAQVENSNTYVIQGKLDLNGNNPPYATILQAVGELIEHWSAEDEEKKTEIVSILKKEIGEHNKIIFHVFPNLAVLLGESDQVETSLPLSFKDRFNEALLSFTNALSHLNQKIVFFLDDLQWADQSTLDFLKLLSSEGKSDNLFWIGAFRDGVVSQRSWLSNPNESEKNRQNHVKTIELKGLSLEVIKEMFEDVIEMKPDRLLKFSELLLQLTGGNPLFVKEALPFLLDDEVLYFDSEVWNYDASQIRDFDKSSQTLDFIIKKMETLAEITKELLGIGSSMGSTFNVTILSAVTEKSVNEIVEFLNPAVERRMIELISNSSGSIGRVTYRFVHDKMQSAAYSLITDDKKQWVHFALGKTYSSSLGNAAQDRNIYNIVNQFNRSETYFNTPSERLDLMKMNLQAGKKAKLAGSYERALQYFNIVIQTIEAKDQNWSNDLVYDVYLESGEAAYLKSDFVSSVMFFESALKYSKTNFQKARIHHNFLVMYNGVNDLKMAWASGLKVLDLLDVQFPENIGKGKVLQQFIKIKWMLRGLEPSSLLDRPDIVNKEAEQVLLTLMEMIAGAWDKKPEVLAFLVLKGFEFILQYGNTPIGYFAISGYGAILGVGFGKIEKGWEFIKLGGRLTQKYDSQIFHGRGLFGVHGTYSYLINHVRENIGPLQDAYSLSKGAGDYSIASYSSVILIENMVTSGIPLNDVENNAVTYFKFLKRTASFDYLSSHKSIVVAVDALKNGYEHCADKIKSIEKRMNRVNFTHIKYTWNLYHLMTVVILNRLDKIHVIVNEIDQEGYNALSSVEILRDIYVSIARTELAIQTKKHQKTIKALKVIKKRVTKLAKINPQNYTQVLALISALIAELKLNNSEAIAQYNIAVQEANANGFIHNAAVFSERLGRQYLKVGENAMAKKAFQGAQASYSNWGATYKSQALQQEVEKLV
jgi:predicted ATPase